MLSFCIKSFLLSFLLIVSITPLYALEVTAEGKDRQNAINQALRQAIDMTLGTTVETRTLSENFQIVRQQILSHSRGYIKRYEILSENTLENGLVRLRLNVEVDDQNLEDSEEALKSLMQMANHPRLLVAGVDEGFDTVASLNPAYDDLILAISEYLQETFRFEVLNPERTRLEDVTPYRFSDRKNNLMRAKRAGADYAIFVTLLKPQVLDEDAPYTLQLEAHKIATTRLIASQSHPFSPKNDEILQTIEDNIHAPVTQLAAQMVSQIQEQVLDKGQAFSLEFNGFDPEKLKFLGEDMSQFDGYQSHELVARKKNSLSLSYRSMLNAHALHREISALLKARDMPFDYRVDGVHLRYRYDDPLFE